jgi:hypothetical protein
MLDTVRKFVYNRTFMLAGATVVSIVLAAFGIEVPHIEGTGVSLVLAVATGLHAVTAEEAAYFQGLFDQIAHNDADETPAA